MIVHDLTQGSNKWHEFRSDHFGASEASAMLGLSTNVTRNELLEMKHNKTPKEYSDWLKTNVFKKGHDTEALSRPLIEEIIGEELYPVTCSDGNLSASCDGLTIDHLIAFEHKQYNAELAAHIALNATLPDEYMPQCQQIMMVTGAKKVVFVTSDGSFKKHSRLEIYPDDEWQEKIRLGWRQFEKDLREFSPKDFKENPEQDTIIELPALSIQIKGEVIASNLPKFKEDAESFIANINTDLNDDNDFANAEATVKFCDETEKKLEQAKKSALSQTASIDEIMRTIDFIKSELRKKRLNLDKKVKSEKSRIKTQIMNDAQRIFSDHVEKLSRDIRPIKLNPEMPDFSVAMKSKRTIESLHNAADTEVAECKILADKKAHHIRDNLAIFNGIDKNFAHLFIDLPDIILKEKDDFALLIDNRVDAHKKSIAAAAEKKIEDDNRAKETVKPQIVEDTRQAEEPISINATCKRIDQIKEELLINSVNFDFYRGNSLYFDIYFTNKLNKLTYQARMYVFYKTNNHGSLGDIYAFHLINNAIQ